MRIKIRRKAILLFFALPIFVAFFFFLFQHAGLVRADSYTLSYYWGIESEHAYVTIESDTGTSYISTIEYRIDGGTWTEFPKSYIYNGASYADFEVSAALVPANSSNYDVELRVQDSNGDYWLLGDILSFVNRDEITVDLYENNAGGPLQLDVYSNLGFTAATQIRIRIDDGSWVAIDPQTSPYVNEYYSADEDYFGVNTYDVVYMTIPNSIIPAGQGVHVEASGIDANGIEFYNETFVDYGTGSGSFNPGQTTENPLEITTSAQAVNFLGNADGNGDIYAVVNIPAAGDYYLDLDTDTDNFAVYTTLFDYGQDSTYSNLVAQEGGEYGIWGVDTYAFRADSSGSYYFKINYWYFDGTPSTSYEILASYGGEADPPPPPVGGTGEITIASTNHVAQGGAISSISVPMNVSGDNRFLAVGVSYRSTNNIQSITFNGDSFIESCDVVGMDYHTEVWYLNNPSAVNANVTITFTAAVNDVVAGAILYTGVNTSDPVYSHACTNTGWDASTWNTRPTATVDSVSGNMVFTTMTAYKDMPSFSRDSGQTSIWEDWSVPNVLGVADYTESTTTSTTVGWTLGTSWPWSVGALSINPAPAENPDPPVASDGSYIVEYVNGIGSTENEWGERIDADANGNTYAVGYFQGTVDFDKNNNVNGDTVTSLGTQNAYIAKYNSSNILQWVKAIGNDSINNAVKDVAVDPSGNIYVSGYLIGEVDFDRNNNINGDTLTSLGTIDAFIAKYDSSGTLQWVKNIGEENSSTLGYALDVDDDGNLFLAGYFNGQSGVDFDRQNTVSGDIKTSNGDYDIFLSKYDTIGNLQWVKAFGSSGYDRITSVDIDAAGNPYVIGVFNGTVDFDEDHDIPGDIKTSTGTSNNAFIAKYSSIGVFQWGTAFESTHEGNGHWLQVGSDGSVFGVGRFEGTIDFDSDNQTEGDTHVSEGSTDIFIVKLDNYGNYLWSRSAGGTGSDWGTAIALDGSDNVYISGRIQTTVDFDRLNTDENNFDVKTSNGGYDGYIAKYSSQGDFQWVKSFGGVGEEYANGLATYSDTAVYVIGNFVGEVDFDQSNSIVGDEQNSSGGVDAFVAKYSEQGGTPTIPLGTGPSSPILLTYQGNTYNFNTNSNASGVVYMKMEVPAAGDYYVFSYEAGDAVDTQIKYYGTDGTYTNLVSENDDYNGDAYSRVDFTAGSAGTYYFTMNRYGGGKADENVGVKYVVVNTTGGPTLNFTQTPDYNAGLRLNLSGTATSSDTSSISKIEVTASVSGEGSMASYSVTPVDGIFNESSEDFTISIINRDANAGATFTYTIKVYDEIGRHTSYSQEYNIDTTRPIVVEADNLGFAPLDDNTLTYTGTVASGDDNVIEGVEYLIFNDYTEGGPDHTSLYILLNYMGPAEIGWTPAQPADGAFDEATEEFTFTTPELVDGQKRVFVRARNSRGNYSDDDSYYGYGVIIDKTVVDYVDSTPPVIQIQEIIPNPTTNPVPTLQGKVRDNLTDKTSNISSLSYKVDEGSWINLNVLDGQIGDEIEESFSIDLTGLSLGEHTVYVSAVDSSGNDTNNSGLNESITFTMIEQPDDLNSTELVKSETFDNHNDQDIIGTDAIWGNGRLRLKESMNLEFTEITTQDTGSRYPNFGAIEGNIYVAPSQTGGKWVSKVGSLFSYIAPNGTEYDFDLTDYGAGDITGQLKELYINNNYILWITNYYGMTGINFGSSITDGQGDTYITKSSGSHGVVLFDFDLRGGNDYAMYYAYADGVDYYKPGNWATTSDDVVVSFNSASGYTLSSIVSIFMDEDSDDLWLGDYGRGLVRLSDGGTPSNSSDDNFVYYNNVAVDTSKVFAIGEDKNDNIYFGGDTGLFIITDQNNTPFVTSDDTIVTLASPAELNNEVIADIAYHNGVYPVGGQFFLATRSGAVIYLSINDTYTDKLDDQFITLEVTNGTYPATVSDIYLQNYNTLVAGIYRKGIYEIDLNRDFATSGYAQTEVNAEIAGRLDVDFITLRSVEVLINAGGITYEVSNDGGLSWYPITVGGTVNFPTTDYRIKFRINMTKGSTPVIGGFELDYAAYATEEDRTLVAIDIADEPEQVIKAQPFSFKIKALDQLDNPFEDETVVDLELRNALDDSVVEDFNVAQAIVTNGEVTINDAQASILGSYYIYAQSDTGADGMSEIIQFVEEAEEPQEPNQPADDGEEETGEGDEVVVPQLSFYATSYEVEAGETVRIYWTSARMTIMTLSSSQQDYGEVATSGYMDVIIEKDTTFTLKGQGNYGDLTRTITIKIKGEVTETIPEIVNFKYKQEGEEGKDKITIEWLVDGADEVSITNIGSNLPLEGSAEVYITKDTEFVLTAKNEYGEVSESLNVEFLQKIVDKLPTTEDASESMDKVVNTVVPATALVLVSTAVAATSGLLSGAISFGNMANKFGILFGYVIRKKKKYWGIVFDIDKSEPIAFAVIRLYKGNNLIHESVSDLDGKYGLLLEATGEYILETQAAGYQTQRQKIDVNRIEDNLEVVKDIPMLSLGKHGGIKELFYYHSVEIIKIIKLVMLVLTLLGFIYSLIVTIEFPGLLNYLILLFYLFVFVLNLISILAGIRRGRGRVVESMTNKPVQGASVRLYDDKAQVGVYLTNKNGEIKIGVKPGNYGVVVSKEGFGTSEIKEVVVDEAGGMVMDIKIEKSPDKQDKLEYANPFGN